MSAVYQVMAQMQRTRPRQTRNPGFMLVVFAFMVVMTLFILASKSGRPRVPAKSQDANQPHLNMAVAGNGFSAQGPVAVVLSLSPEGEWIELEHGQVSEEKLHEIMVARRDFHHSKGWQANVEVRIGAEESAQHIKRIYEIAEECGMDQLLLSTWQPDSEKS